MCGREPLGPYWGGLRCCFLTSGQRSANGGPESALVSGAFYPAENFDLIRRAGGTIGHFCKSACEHM